MQQTPLSRYEAILRVHLMPRFGPVPLNAIERSDLTSWVSELHASGLAGPTVRHVFAVLQGVLGAAALDGRIARNPASGIKLPRERQRTKRFLTHDEVSLLADACGDDAVIIRVLAFCGLRFGELAALRVRNVDTLRRRLRIEKSVTEVNGVMVFGTPKSHQRRDVPIPASLLDEVALACRGKSPDDLGFTASMGGVIYLRNWRSRVFNVAAKRVGLAPLSPHELRHTSASLAVAAGANVKAVHECSAMRRQR